LRGAEERPLDAPAEARRAVREAGASCEVSVVVPVLDEAGTLRELVERAGKALQGRDYEIILVDDGSTDGSTEAIRELAASDARVRGIILRGNFGKAAALTAGFEESSGRSIVTIDADLQESPEEIPALLGRLDEGFDVVSGWRRQRNDPWHKRLPSRLYNAVTSLATGVYLHDHNCGFKAYRREVWEEISVHGELHRYIPAMAAWRRFRVAETPVTHSPRRYGRSKYGLKRLLKGFLDLLTVLLITRYMARPLHLFGGAGAAMSATGFLVCLYLTALKLVWGERIGDRPLLLLGVLLIVVGIQLVSVGLLGEMLGHLHRGRREYSVKEVLGPGGAPPR
jgi:glycosyltransferase involved in cell wall biosynthesis